MSLTALLIAFIYIALGLCIFGGGLWLLRKFRGSLGEALFLIGFVLVSAAGVAWLLWSFGVFEGHLKLPSFTA